MEPYPIVCRIDPEQQFLQQQQHQSSEQRPYSEATSFSSDSATGIVSAHGEKQHRLSLIADRSPETERTKEYPRQSNLQQAEVNLTILYLNLLS